MTAAISAYVPCYNNVGTLRRAVEGVLGQSPPATSVFVVDDGSSDDSLATLAGLPVRTVRHETNLGRGATRARAMREAAHEFVLCCDATNVLEPEFGAKALRWFEDPAVAAVFGIFRQDAAHTTAGRWRGRHLFKLGAARSIQRDALLATSGALVRRSAVVAAGGFNPTLRHSEDADLGRRLLAHGYAVVCDPGIGFVSISENTVGEVLERYWRWYAGEQEAVTWRGYAGNIGYAIKSMVPEDLRAGDFGSAAISLVCPHYQYWKSRARARSRAR